MNIKKAEELTGVSRQNIRFYEREGLLHPDRNAENDYREYNDTHIHTLKLIRAMRMLDMPLDRIRSVLEGELSPADAAAEQQQKLKQQQAQLAAAIRFCEEWTSLSALENMDVDAVLARMEQPENSRSLFQQWREDYRKVVLSEQQKAFTFIPDEGVTTPQEFTNALFSYANQHNLDLVVTKEGMYPEFTIGGIEYRAQRIFTVVHRMPLALIRCSVKYPEDFEPDVPPVRKKLMKILRLWWIFTIYGLILVWMVFSWEGLFSGWEGWVLVISFGALLAVSLYRMQLTHFHEMKE